MTTSDHTVLCGWCGRPVVAREEHNAEGDHGCRECENWATKAEVFDMAKQYVVDAAQIALNRAAADVAKSSKFITFKGDTKLTKSYRFKVDGIL